LEFYYKDKNKDLIKLNQESLKIINQDYLPVLTKEDYFTIPKFTDLLKQNQENLQKIENFCIFNAFGMIEFENSTDVTFQNLDEIIDINENYVKILYFFKKKLKIFFRLKSTLIKFLTTLKRKNQIWVKN